MKFYRYRTNTFSLAAVYVKVNLSHFLRRRKQWRKSIKKCQKFIFWFTYITILVSVHSPLPINHFLHPGGLAKDQVLKVTLLCVVQPQLQECLLSQLEVGAVVVLQLLLHCWKGPLPYTAQLEPSCLIFEAFSCHVHIICVWPAKTFGGHCIYI